MSTVQFATSLATQDRWGVLVAAYLFLGGMGAALIATSVLAHRYFSADRAITLWGVLSGEAFLGVGSALLLLDLLHPMRVWEILLPWNQFVQHTSWIAWGTQFIIWAMVAGLLYIWPLMLDEPWFRRLPVLGGLLEAWFNLALIRQIGRLTQALRTPLAWLAILCGLGTALYTGLLLRSFPAAALWANALVPPLFTVSAFSTALAWLLLVMYGVLKQHGSMARVLERLDVLLIAVEIVLVAGILFGVLPHSLSGKASYALLMNNAGWLAGFLGLGLLLPFALELKGVLAGWKQGAPVMLASVLVLMGGFLLRHYFLASGVYVFPWGNTGHAGLVQAGIYHLLTVH